MERITKVTLAAIGFALFSGLASSADAHGTRDHYYHRDHRPYYHRYQYQPYRYHPVCRWETRYDWYTKRYVSYQVCR